MLSQLLVGGIKCVPSSMISRWSNLTELLSFIPLLSGPTHVHCSFSTDFLKEIHSPSSKIHHHLFSLCILTLGNLMISIITSTNNPCSLMFSISGLSNYLAMSRYPTVTSNSTSPKRCYFSLIHSSNPWQCPTSSQPPMFPVLNKVSVSAWITKLETPASAWISSSWTS